ncbi:MAG: DMT family transporter, partial [Paludibacteraceae bacterium]|nr:DMT family transporter [Paludibacteraceae bacterium]
MMWIWAGLVSAALIGCYDICKKMAVRNNAVMPILWITMFISSVLLIPMYVLKVPTLDVRTHMLVFVKACLVLSSGICAYTGIKHVPLTLASPINSTRPMWVILGAVMIFGERLTLQQWLAVGLVVVSFIAFSVLGAREGFSLRTNKYIWLVILGMLFGVCSGLYDKYLLSNVDRFAVQCYYTFEQMMMMLVILAIYWWPRRKQDVPFQWRWSILLISVFWVMSEAVYFFALSQPDALVSVLSVIRRSGVILPFLWGAVVLHDRNIGLKAIALSGVLAGVV